MLIQLAQDLPDPFFASQILELTYIHNSFQIQYSTLSVIETKRYDMISFFARASSKKHTKIDLKDY